MRNKSKKSYFAKLKFQIVLEALTSDKGDSEIARAYDVHPVSLSKWKRQFLDSGAEIFSGNATVKTIESFWGRFKTENKTLIMQTDALAELICVTEQQMTYYNQGQRHSALNYRVPQTSGAGNSYEKYHD